MYAIAEGHDELALALIEKGADVNTKDNWGVSTLRVATNTKRKKIAKAILDKSSRSTKYEFDNTILEDGAMEYEL